MLDARRVQGEALAGAGLHSLLRDMASIASFVSAIAAPQAHSLHAERKGSVLVAAQQRQCDKKRLSSSAVTDGLLTLPFLEPPMVGYTCRVSSVADSCPGLADAGLDSSGEQRLQLSFPGNVRKHHHRIAPPDTLCDGAARLRMLIEPFCLWRAYD